MGVNFISTKVTKETMELMEQAKIEFRKHHPELNQMFLSNNKIIYEAMVFYLDN